MNVVNGVRVKILAECKQTKVNALFYTQCAILQSYQCVILLLVFDFTLTKQFYQCVILISPSQSNFISV